MFFSFLSIALNSLPISFISPFISLMTSSALRSTTSAISLTLFSISFTFASMSLAALSSPSLIVLYTSPNVFCRSEYIPSITVSMSSFRRKAISLSIWMVCLIVAMTGRTFAQTFFATSLPLSLRNWMTRRSRLRSKSSSILRSVEKSGIFGVMVCAMSRMRFITSCTSSAHSTG